MSNTLQHPKNIILAVDGSENSLIAATLIRDLPLLPDTQITNISVVPSRFTDNQSVHRALLDESIKFFEKANIKTNIQLLHGHPAEAIINFAKENPSDLITLGARGLRATLGILLGGVAQQVVEYSCCPVLIVRGPYNGIKKVVLVTDHSIHSEAALNYIEGFSFLKNTRIVVMHVLPPLPTPELIARSWAVPLEAINPIALQEIEENIERSAREEKEEAEKKMAGIIQCLQSTGHQATSVINHGDAATEILDYVEENEVDLVVAGSRGLSQIRGWLLGSVSRKLVHYAKCSVLIVKEASETLPA